MEKIQSNTTSLTLHPLIQALWSTHLKIYRQSQTNATIAIMHHLTRAIWIDTWNHIIVKNPINVLKTTQNPIWQTIHLIQTNATSVNIHLTIPAILGHTWKHTMSSPKNATIVIMHHLVQDIWRDTWKHTTHATKATQHPIRQTIYLSQRSAASVNIHLYNAGYLRTHLKTHYSKSNECNHCDYASSHTSHLKRHMKSHDRQFIWAKQAQPVWILRNSASSFQLSSSIFNVRRRRRRRRSFVCPASVTHPLISTIWFLDHTNHIFSVRIWSWQHVSVIF